MKNIPKSIFLQVGDDHFEDVDFNDLVGITWHFERINKSDIEYQLKN